MHNSLNETLLFSSPIYNIGCKEFLDTVSLVAEENRTEEIVNEIYPLSHTYTFHDDERLSGFSVFILNCGMTILQNQGYKIDDIDLVIGEMWMQVHKKSSSMDCHVHGYGSQLSGFYILQSDGDSSRICFHDPRPGKIQSEIRENNIANITHASRLVSFTPEEGTLYLSNSWVPHSFTRNISDKEFKFVHFNLYPISRQNMTQCSFEEPKGPIII